MSSQPIPRAATIVVAALLLGGAFVVGAAYSGRQANAATVYTLPVGSSTPSGGGTGTASAGSGITVSGTAQVAGTPDTLRLSLAVTTKASTVDKALEQANRATASVQSALRSRGVASKDLQTSDLQIQPEYRYPSDGTPVADGYTVTEGLNVVLRDIRKAGATISAATAAGGNAIRVNGITLALEDTGTLVSAARDKAVADARAKAEQYAKAVGRPLGPVTSLAESVSQPPPMDYAMAPMASVAKAVPIAPGSQNVGVTVTLTYAFAQ
jgi:uncharacterized protein YggE